MCQKPGDEDPLSDNGRTVSRLNVIDERAWARSLIAP
jgi:hypothetical protein